MISIPKNLPKKPQLLAGLLLVLSLCFLAWYMYTATDTSTKAPAIPTAPATHAAAATSPASVMPASSTTISQTPVSDATTSAVASSSPATDAAPATTSAPAVTASAAAPLPTDRTTAEEELDKLKDEHDQLATRKAQLLKQLETSSKIMALKDQQIREMEKDAGIAP